MDDARKFVGDDGENRACAYLLRRGYEILRRNYRTNGGEIDIIAASAGTVIFVEVKTFPRGTPELLAGALGRRKQKRIVKTAKCFLAKNRQYSSSYIRFDVIVNDMPGFPPVYHLENAFAELL
ncbi:MAG: YraN family protein [Treponemataceae bacterium]|nr:YraN family protein [Treponemataceae bacterium]